MAVRLRKDGRWSCYYRGPDGKQKEEYFGRGARGESAAWRRNEELGLKKRKQPDSPLFSDLAKTYVQSKNFNANSRKMLLIRLESIILPFFGNRMAQGLRDQDMDNYVRKRRKDGVKYATITRELTDVKAILNFAVKRRPQLIMVNPVRDYQKPGDIDLEEILPPTPAEAEKILKNASPHVARAIKLSWFLGLRPGSVELFSLTWDRVSWENRTIRVTAAAKGRQNRRRTTTRQVPIHKDFYDELLTWYKKDRRENGPLIHYHGRAIKSMQTAWKNTLKSAKIKRRIRPYDMRHYFVTRALEAGADIKALSEVVGSSPKTIMKHYQHVTQDMHRQTVDTIPALTTPVADKIPRRKKKRSKTRRGKK